jgi:uncharacterized protein YndB with AHSA1/START domain
MNDTAGQDRPSYRRRMRVQVPSGRDRPAFSRHGKDTRADPHKRLSYTYVVARSGSGASEADSLFPDVTDSVVTWTLDALPDGKTRVTVVHSGIASEAHERFDGAWGYWTVSSRALVGRRYEGANDSCMLGRITTTAVATRDQEEPPVVVHQNSY